MTRFDGYRFLGFLICTLSAAAFVVALWGVAVLLGLAEVGR